MSYFLGIDGGGSQTTCLVGDEKSILGSGSAVGSNIVRVGEAQAREAITAAVRQACAAAQIAPSQVQRTCAGMAGGARPEVSGMVQRILAEVVGGEIEVAGDMVIALEVAFGGGPGVVVIAGTGSIAYGRNVQGQTARAGGWGYAISDEGSGQWIGRLALGSALRACDEGSHLQLLEEMMKAWAVSGREQMIMTANAVPPPDFSALSPLVFAAADSGDALAQSVLTSAGRELAALAKTVIVRIFAGSGSVPVAMCGGVFRNSAWVRKTFYNNLCSEFPHAALQSAVVDPAQGALELARKGGGRGTGK